MNLNEIRIWECRQVSLLCFSFQVQPEIQCILRGEGTLSSHVLWRATQINLHIRLSLNPISLAAGHFINSTAFLEGSWLRDVPYMESCSFTRKVGRISRDCWVSHGVLGLIHTAKLSPEDVSTCSLCLQVLPHGVPQESILDEWNSAPLCPCTTDTGTPLTRRRFARTGSKTAQVLFSQLYMKYKANILRELPADSHRVAMKTWLMHGVYFVQGGSNSVQEQKAW